MGNSALRKKLLVAPSVTSLFSIFLGAWHLRSGHNRNLPASNLKSKKYYKYVPGLTDTEVQPISKILCSKLGARCNPKNNYFAQRTVTQLNTSLLRYFFPNSGKEAPARILAAFRAGISPGSYSYSELTKQPRTTS